MRVFLLSVLVLLWHSPAGAAQAASGELIERTQAIVGGEAITLSDVRTAQALGLVQAGDVDAATERLVERTLVLREVERYAPPEPSPAAVAARLDGVQASAGGEDAVAQVLTAGGFTRERLRAWIRNDLRIAAYLDQRFAAVVVPSAGEVSAVYAERRDEFARRNLGPEAAADDIRAELTAGRRASLIADWIADLRRRTPVVELWKN